MAEMKVVGKKSAPKKKTSIVPVTTRVDLPAEWSQEKGLKNYITLQKRLMSFVKDNLREGIDYGPTWPGDEKKNILIAGCEKVVLWLKLVERIFPDVDSFAMLGSPEKTVCYVDYLVRYQDVPQVDKLIKKYGIENEEMVYRMLSITTGRGAATVDGTTVKDPNVAVKKARIRAKKDAVLSLGLHNEFTQDAEEYAEGQGPDNGQQSMAEPKEKKKKKPPKEEKKEGVNSVCDECLTILKSGAFKDHQQQVMSLEKHTVRLQKEKNLTALVALRDSIKRQQEELAKKQAGG